MTSSQVKICQSKSSARVPERQRKILKALGLSGKLHQWKSHTSSPSVWGMIHKTRHLLTVAAS